MVYLSRQSPIQVATLLKAVILVILSSSPPKKSSDRKLWLAMCLTLWPNNGPLSKCGWKQESSKLSNLCGPDPPSFRQTDRRHAITNRNTALCTTVHRAIKMEATGKVGMQNKLNKSRMRCSEGLTCAFRVVDVCRNSH